MSQFKSRLMLKSQVTVDVKELSKVSVDVNEPSQVTIDRHKSSHVSADRHKSSQVTLGLLSALSVLYLFATVRPCLCFDHVSK